MNLPTKIVNYGATNSIFGKCFVAWFDNNICQLSFFQEEEKEMLSFIKKFGKYDLIENNTEAEKIISDLNNNTLKMQLYTEGTVFQKSVWKALQQIPFGSLSTYAEIAQKIGHPKAVRAVGTAVGANPIAFFIPCHRVIRTDGGLGGFRWGLEVKKKMLAFESL